MAAIKLYKSRREAVKLALLSSPFVFVGVYGLWDSPGSWLGWACTLFFGVGFVAGIYNAFDRKPKIVIDEVGILDYQLGEDIINWEIIQEAYLGSIGGQVFISLKIDEAYEPSARKGGVSKVVSNLNKSMGFQELNLMLGTVVVDEVKLVMIINAMAQSATPPEQRRLLESYA